MSGGREAGGPGAAPLLPEESAKGEKGESANPVLSCDSAFKCKVFCLQVRGRNLSELSMKVEGAPEATREARRVLPLSGLGSDALKLETLGCCHAQGHDSVRFPMEVRMFCVCKKK